MEDSAELSYEDEEQQRTDYEEGLLGEYQERIRLYEEREAQLLYAAEIGQALLEENQQLKEISKRLEIENEELSNKNQALEVRCGTLDELKRLSEEEIVKLNEDISTLEHQLRTSRNELKASAQIAAQFKTLQAELDSWKEESRQSKEAEESQRRINAQLSIELKRIEKEKEESITKDVQVDVLKVQSERLHSAEAAREQLQRSLSSLVEENDQLKRSAEEKERLVKLVNSLVLANKHLQDVQEEYKCSLEEARYKIEALTVSINDLKLSTATSSSSSSSRESNTSDGSIFGELISIVSPKPKRAEETKQPIDFTPPQPRRQTYDQSNPYATLRTTRRRTQSTIETKPLVPLPLANTPTTETQATTMNQYQMSEQITLEEPSVLIVSTIQVPMPELDNLLPYDGLPVAADSLFEFPPQRPDVHTQSGNHSEVASLSKEKEEQTIRMELFIQQLQSELDIRNQKASQAKEHELQLLTTVFILRERLSASYETLMSPQMRDLIEIHELLAISDTVVGSVMSEAKELLAYEGERKLFGLANEMACQVLELLLELTELAKKLNSNYRKQYQDDLMQKIDASPSNVSSNGQKPPESPLKSWFSSLWTKKDQQAQQQASRDREFEDFGAK